MNSGNGEDIIDRPNRDINMDNHILNEPFTEIEVKKAMKTLKNNKCGGIDSILNEFIKNSPDILIEIIVKLFNVILDSEFIPTDWFSGIIKPIFKNKGDPRDPSNYRGIIILSCLGKLFTSCTNTRLTSYSKSCDIIGKEQAGFRQGFFNRWSHFFFKDTNWSIFVFKKKRLYCCFVDYSEAFDTVNRAALWSKLLAKVLVEN